MKKYLVVKEMYEGQILSLVLPGMGKVKIDTSKIVGDKSFYIQNGLGYLFEEVSILKNDWDNLITDLSDEAISYLESINVCTYKDYLDFNKNILKGYDIEKYIKSLNISDEKEEVIDIPIEEEKVELTKAEPVKKNKGGRPKKDKTEIPVKK